MWWTSRGSPLSTARPVRIRSPVRTRCWWTAEVASSDGIAARSASSGRSERTMTLAPPRIASDASAQSRISAVSMPSGPVGDRPGHVEHLGAQPAVVERPHHRRLLVREHRLLEDELRLGQPVEVQQVLLGPEAGAQAHHDVLANRVDRRVRDLREALLEVREQAGRVLGEHRQGDVVPHRPGRLLGVARHRRQHDADVLLRVAERELRPAKLVGLRDPLRRDLVGRDVLHRAPCARRPIRPTGRRVVTSRSALPSSRTRPRSRSTQNMLPGPEPALAGDLLLGHLERARLRGDRDPAVLGDQPAARAQPVAVERRAHEAAVGEDDRRRPVPGLDQARVVVVEALRLGRDQALAVLVGARDHHHRRVGERAAREAEQLEDVVEGERVRGAGRDQRQAALEVRPEQRRLQDRLAGLHPVDVPGDRVDLAVVGDHPVRVGELPARERVGREARVDDREGAPQLRVAQVGVEARELGRGQHPLVDDGPRRDRGERDLGRAQLGDPPDHEQLALERVLVGRVGARGRSADGGSPASPCGRWCRSAPGRSARRASRAGAAPPRRRCARAPARAPRGARRRWAGSRRPPRPRPAAAPGRRRGRSRGRERGGTRGGAGSGSRRRRRSRGRPRRRRDAPDGPASRAPVRRPRESARRRAARGTRRHTRRGRGQGRRDRRSGARRASDAPWRGGGPRGNSTDKSSPDVECAARSRV